MHTHDQYEDCAPKWKRARDVIAGEDAIKGAGEAYLKKLTAMSDSDYLAYKGRAKWLGATNRTLDGLEGMVFRKDPEIKIPEENQKLSAEMNSVKDDADLKGAGLAAYAKNTVGEVITVGRAGTLVDYNVSEKRPYFAFYRAEDIWNWRMKRVNGVMMLSMVALHEVLTHQEPPSEVPKRNEIPEMKETIVEQLLVCSLVNIPVPNARKTSMAYVVNVWQMLPDSKDPKKKSWQWIETRNPSRREEPLNFIPFVFHSPDASMPDCCKLPLEDLISVNLHHYRLSADYNHGLHFTALPTPWVAGFDSKQELRIGSGIAWVSDKTDAKAGFLEYTGQGLGAIKEALDDDKRDMAMLGARLLQEQKREAETAEAVRLKQSGESSVLTDIAMAVSRSLSEAMRICYWWLSTETMPKDVDAASASMELNTDYVEARLDAADLNALVASWISAAISHKTLLENLRRGEILSKTRTDEEEMDLIEAQGPPVGQPRNNGGAA